MKIKSIYSVLNLKNPNVMAKINENENEKSLDTVLFELTGILITLTNTVYDWKRAEKGLTPEKIAELNNNNDALISSIRELRLK
jgi:sensor histidine kinase regulating citrate/malate metabolism